MHCSQDGARTFHCLHKDLLLLTGVLFVQQHAVKDAAKCACQRQTTGFLFEGKGQERHSQRHHIQRSKCHLAHRSPRLADLWTEVDRLLLKMLCLLKGLGSFGSRLTDERQNKSDSLELRGPFIA